MHLLHLGKLLRPKYQYKLNKIMRISQKDAILIKKISTCQSSVVHEGCWVNFLRRVGNLEASIVCWRESAKLVKYIMSIRQSGSGRPRSACSNGGQAKNTHVNSRYCVKLALPFQCAPDNSPQSPAQMLQTMSCSAVVWSQSRLPSHSLINQLSVCNKSCYCSFIKP